MKIARRAAHKIIADLSLAGYPINGYAMAIIQKRFAQNVLFINAVYLFACALSAIWAPASWLWASGLPMSVSNELGLVFGVLGAYLMALGVGAIIARASPERNSGLILTLFLCHAFDFLSTLSAVARDALPLLHGSIFIGITLLWATLLFLVWLNYRRCA